MKFFLIVLIFLLPSLGRAHKNFLKDKEYKNFVLRYQKVKQARKFYLFVNKKFTVKFYGIEHYKRKKYSSVYRGGPNFYTKYKYFHLEQGRYVKDKEQPIRFLVKLTPTAKIFLRKFILKNGHRILNLERVGNNSFVVMMIEKKEFKALRSLMSQRGALYASEPVYKLYLNGKEHQIKIDKIKPYFSNKRPFRMSGFFNIGNHRMCFFMKQDNKHFKLSKEILVIYDLKTHQSEVAFVVHAEPKYRDSYFHSYVNFIKKTGSLIFAPVYTENVRQIEVILKK